MTVVLGWPTPDPGLGAPIQLLGGHTGGLLDLFGIGEALPGKRIAAEEPPPAFLQIEPACSRRDEDVVNARMLLQPGARLQARVTAEIVADDEEVSPRVVGFDVR